MQRFMLKSKIHRATLTGTDLDYEGSITVDQNLLDKADMLPGEEVHVLNINNGARFTTYAIEGKEGRGDICLNGAAARLAVKGDTVIILTYCHVSDDDIRNFAPKIVHVDARNAIVKEGEPVFA